MADRVVKYSPETNDADRLDWWSWSSEGEHWREHMVDGEEWEEDDGSITRSPPIGWCVLRPEMREETREESYVSRLCETRWLEYNYGPGGAVSAMWDAMPERAKELRKAERAREREWWIRDGWRVAR